MTEGKDSEILFCVVTLKRFTDLVNSASAIQYGSVPELFGQLEHRGGQWPMIPGADALDDSTIFQHLAPLLTAKARVLVVSEVSYKRGSGAFEMEARKLPQFIASHRGLFRETLFNGDVLFFDPDDAVLVAFHHEGAYARFSLRDAE